MSNLLGIQKQPTLDSGPSAPKPGFLKKKKQPATPSVKTGQPSGLFQKLTGNSGGY